MHRSFFFRTFAVDLSMKKSIKMVLFLLLVLFGVSLAMLFHPAFGLWRHRSTERIQASPNYRDGMFKNQEPTIQFTGSVNDRDKKKNALGTLWRFMTNKDPLRVPQEPLPAVKTDIKNLPKDSDWLVWFGHSSYLFCLNGKLVLVDPIFQPKWPSSMMLKAFPGTAIYQPDDMPDIDVLVVTHEHWDHMDYAALKALRERVQTVVCPLGIADYLRFWGYSDEQITEMDWYESQSVRCGMKVTCLPTRHFSNRLLGKRNQTLWASFMVESTERKVYIGGDGGYDKRFKEIREQFGSVDLAFLEDGQYNANWRYIHTMPEDLEKAILDLQAKHVFTVHHDKFALSVHPWNEPDSIAQEIAAKQHISLLDAPQGAVVNF